MTLHSGWVRSALFLSLLVCGTGAGVENPLAPLGPVGHWKGDDGEMPTGAADASGNNRTGAYSKGAGTAATAAQTKFPNPGCFSLDGVSGMVTIPDAPSLRMTADFTVAFWKKKTAPNADWVRIVGKGNGAQRNYGIWEFPAAENRLKFQIFNQNGGSVLELDSPGPTPMNEWTHVIVSIGVNSATMYLNGQRVAAGAKTGDAGTSADPVTIGHAGYHGFFAGQVDDVRIYNRCLSMSEVVFLAQGNGPPDPPKDLTLKNAAPKFVNLSWAPSPTPPPVGTFTTYVVRRSKTAGKDYEVVLSGLPTTLCTDMNADAGATYYYVVTAVNTGGESAVSNELTVAVPAK
jgi:hypothetical protein